MPQLRVTTWLLCLALICWADIKSTTGTITFKADGQNTQMVLKSEGLGIGTTTPSANLEVQGNTLMSTQLSIGGSNSSASNLSIQGSFALMPKVLSSASSLDEHSLYLLDTSSGHFDLELPYAGNHLGRIITFKKTSQNNRVVLTAAGGNIDGSDEVTLSSSDNIFPYLRVIANGDDSFILQRAEQGVSALATDNLIGWWRFEDGSGASATDSSGAGNDGTLHASMDFSTNTVTGYIGSALSFDGDNDTVDLVDDPFDLTASMTITAWVYWVDAGTSHIISKNAGSDVPFQFAIEGGSGALRSYSANPGVFEAIDSTSTISEQVWTHVTMVRDADRGEVTFYIDGVQDAAGWQTYNAASIDLNAITVNIGSRGDETSSHYEGYLDEIRIYDRALEGSEIADIAGE